MVSYLDRVLLLRGSLRVFLRMLRCTELQFRPFWVRCAGDFWVDHALLTASCKHDC
jgi:hypothetical protein